MTPFIGNPKVYGFYLADEPDPTGKWGPLATAADLKAESDWIHANVPGAKTFIVQMNIGTDQNPVFPFTPANTGIDLYGLDPYPGQVQFGGFNYSIIPTAVNAAVAQGIPLSQIVPVYQAFGGGGYASYIMPDAAQAQQILATWGTVVPHPAFDYVYSWGSQTGNASLASSPELQQVFAAANDPPCYTAGTRIATPGGDVPVEELRAGVSVLSVFGGTAEVVWVGRRRIDCRNHPRPERVWPVRVRAHAFGPGLPWRDLLLSPEHAVHVDEVLIPIGCLVNGTTVVRERVEEITYFHVELPQHDVILAEGLPAESYLDTGNRTAFEGGGPALDLHPDFAREMWEAGACAPQVRYGPILAAVRQRLSTQAAALGMTMTSEPLPRYRAAGG
ncbi:Hint domain-containing protein [Limobrevibacterium gyesilva]|uniref:Hint domain-containing protein n=1 Tax=Limobrevibacterium gyesilva TaxID=2991712 RepID=UPI0022265C90